MYRVQQNNLPISLDVEGEAGKTQRDGNSGTQRSGGGSFLPFCPHSNQSITLRWQSLQWRGQMRRELLLLRRSFTTMTIVAAQRAFRTQLQIPSHVSVLDRKSILLWVKSFRETGSVVKKRGGRQRSSHIPELIDAVRNSIL